MVNIQFRTAIRSDVASIVKLLADDPLGAKRERFEVPVPDCYFDAFDSIDADPNNKLILATNDDSLAGVLQLTFIPSITFQGRWRAQIEGVRVAASSRGLGIGKRLIQYAISKAKDRDCHLVQLTTDNTRKEAIEFYNNLGFIASHQGMKLKLGD